MLTVRTAHLEERQRLEEEFRSEEGHIAVPLAQTATLATLIEAITFEHFHNAPCPLARMLQQYATDALALTLSLDLYRQLIKEIQRMNDRERLLQEYLLAMNAVVNEEPLSPPSAPEPQPEPGFEQLLEESLLEGRSSSLLEMVEMPLLRLESGRAEQEEAQSEATKNSASTSSSRQPLDSLAKLGNFFYSPSAVYSRQDWRTERKEDSESLGSFRKKGEGVMEANSSLCVLLASELAYDMRREAREGRAGEGGRAEQRYQRGLKEALLFGKIHRRRR